MTPESLLFPACFLRPPTSLGSLHLTDDQRAELKSLWAGDWDWGCRKVGQSLTMNPEGELGSSHGD